jgi:hypothetical protein
MAILINHQSGYEASFTLAPLLFLKNDGLLAQSISHGRNCGLNVACVFYFSINPKMNG